MHFTMLLTVVAALLGRIYKIRKLVGLVNPIQHILEPRWLFDSDM